MAKCQERASQLGNTKGIGRDQIHLNDLVLLRLSPQELQKYHTFEGSMKLRPKWSLPYRVIQITPDGQAAQLRCLISGSKRQLPLRKAHIQDLRFISPPRDLQQRAEWERIIAEETLGDFRNLSKRRVILNQFWEKVEPTGPNKRLRVE
jgi:hypothetical protein